MKAKLNQFTLEEAIKKAEHYDFLTKHIKDISLKPDDEINKNANDILNKVMHNVIRKRLKEEVI